MNTERDEYLTKKMGGKKIFACYVEGDPIFDCVMDKGHDETWSSCTHGTENGKREDCAYWKEEFTDGVTDFSIWEGFGKLIELMDNEMSDQEIADMLHSIAIDGCIQNLPDRAANLVHEFMKGRE